MIESKTISLRLDEESDKLLDKFANERNMSRSQAIRLIIKAYIKGKVES